MTSLNRIKMDEAFTFTHSVSLNGGQMTEDVIRTGPAGVFVQSYLTQFETQLVPGCLSIYKNKKC